MKTTAARVELYDVGRQSIDRWRRQWLPTRRYRRHCTRIEARWPTRRPSGRGLGPLGTLPLARFGINVGHSIWPHSAGQRRHQPTRQRRQKRRQPPIGSQDRRRHLGGAVGPIVPSGIGPPTTLALPAPQRTNGPLLGLAGHRQPLSRRRPLRNLKARMDLRRRRPRRRGPLGDRPSRAGLAGASGGGGSCSGSSGAAANQWSRLARWKSRPGALSRVVAAVERGWGEVGGARRRVGGRARLAGCMSLASAAGSRATLLHAR